MKVEEIFNKLWNQYSSENPSANKIHQLFEKEGEEIVNDHIAFRTFDDPRVNINVLAKPFLTAGYKEAGNYNFPNKNLEARHFELEGMPRVFISELKTEAFSPELQSIVKQVVDEIPHDVLESEELIVSGAVFGKPLYSIYERMRKESEYAAWIYAYGYRANHFTISVNHFNKYDTLEKLNTFLKENGFEMNSSGGEIKGSPEQLLEQSSTLADHVTLEFQDGAYSIPSCYYEFAKRYKDKNGKIFSGFIAGSADKIFESTDRR